MALGSPLPTFLELNYDSAWGNHRMIIPTTNVTGVGSVGLPYGSFRKEDGTPLGTGAGEVGSYVRNFAEAMIDTLPGEGRVRSWLIWQVANVAAYKDGTDRNQVPDPITGDNFDDVVSSGAIVHWTSKAVQWTLSFNCSNPRSILRIQIMNACMTATDLNTNLALRPEKSALIGLVTADDTFLRSRQGGIPNGISQDAVTLNEKLRRAYRMV